MDLWGPAHLSSNGNLYYLIIVDVFTIYTWIHFLNKKSDVSNIYPQFHKTVENQLEFNIKSIQKDGEGEFRALAPYLI